MKSKVKISVVIPIYNRKEELDTALQSLNKQSIKDFEVVIVDDGSDVCYTSVLHKYTTINIKYKKIQHTGNIARVRNEALKICEGKYIAVLDSDDYCEKKRLEIQSKVLDNNPMIDILATWVHIISDVDNENSERLSRLYNENYDTDGIIYQNMNYGCCICHSSVMLKKQVLVKLGGYDENYNICEDYKLWMDAIKHNYSIYVLPQKLTYRTLHSDSVTSSFEGTTEAIKKVVTIKLNYLNEQIGYAQKLLIMGDSARNALTLPLIRKYLPSMKVIKVVNIYNGYPKDIDADYIFVSTFKSREKVFSYLESKNKKAITDFIYL